MSDITCKELGEEMLLQWLHGSLEPSLAEQVERHVEECERCSAELETLRKEEDLIRGALRMEPDLADEGAYCQESWLRGSQATITTARGRFGRAKSSRLWWVGIAASVFLVLALANQSGFLLGGGDEAEGPLVSASSMSAKPGETVLIPIRAENLNGRSGLQAKLIIDPNMAQIKSAESLLGVCSVKGGEATVVTLSADAWKEQDGIAFRLPVSISETTPRNTIIRLDFVSVQLTDARRTKLKARTRGAEINVI